MDNLIRIPTAEDYMYFTFFTDPSGNMVKGNFPIYIRGISQCCVDNDDKVTVTKVTIPQEND